MDIQRIQRVKIREVWPHEAHDFTTWLEQNIDVLDDDLAFPLDPESVKREESAGSFNVDLVAEDANGRTVIIENQLGRSDHDHLGKVLTYLSAFDAEVAVWIAGDPRPEHVKAVTWLNDTGSVSAYFFKIEAIRIGDSPAAPLLTLIVGPSEDAKDIASTKQEKSRRETTRRRYWETLLAHASDRTKLHSGRSATAGGYLGGSTGYRGLDLNYAVTQHGTSSILWIEKGPEWAEWNQAVYSYLLDHRDQIETDLGRPLTWDAKEGNRSRKLIAPLDGGGWVDEDDWPSIIEATVELMIEFEAAVRPHLKNAVAQADQTAHPESG